MEKTYTAAQVKEMLDASMKKFQSGMIQIIRECAKSPKYGFLPAQEALESVAEKLEKLGK